MTVLKYVYSKYVATKKKRWWRGERAALYSGMMERAGNHYCYKIYTGGQEHLYNYNGCQHNNCVNYLFSF